MNQSVLILDTSILCVWLKLPGMESCGESADIWNFSRVDQEIEDAKSLGYTLVLPLATLIETGNHIAHLPRHRRDRALALAETMCMAADETSPWAAFKDQEDLWSAVNLKRLGEDWPTWADAKLSMGDFTIKDVSDYYHRMGCDVSLLSGDH